MTRSWIFWCANAMTGLCLALGIKVLWVNWAALPASTHLSLLLVLPFVALSLVNIWKELYQGKEKEVRSWLPAFLSLTLAVDILFSVVKSMVR